MRIAFVTYEYPPDIAKGGIATYVQQAALMLRQRGHSVEVFCGSNTRSISEMIDEVYIHRILTTNPEQFRTDCLSIFDMRHTDKPFDILESPEINSSGLLIKQKFPLLPLVVKLHMPLFLQMKLNNFYTHLFTKIRFFLGALRRGKYNYIGKYNYKADKDFLITELSDAIVAPAPAIKIIIQNAWKIDQQKIEVIPYPFTPPNKILSIPISNLQNKIVLFAGRLDVQKGIVNLIKAIPLVIKSHPNVLFKIIGNDGYYSRKKIKMSDYIKKQLSKFSKNISLLGPLEYDHFLDELSTASVCTFPSLWENYGLVCAEAMAAGRAVIGTKEGGMKTMLENGAGIIVDPLDYKQLANYIISLLNNDELRMQYGKIARAKILSDYNNDIIGKKMEAHFYSVINNYKSSKISF